MFQRASHATPGRKPSILSVLLVAGAMLASGCGGGADVGGFTPAAELPAAKTSSQDTGSSPVGNDDDAAPTTPLETAPLSEECTLPTDAAGPCTTDITGQAAQSRVGIDLTAVEAYCWDNGSVLRVGFLDGNPELIAKVVSTASQWMDYANITFVFETTVDPNSTAPIRITFQGDGEAWSKLGKSALGIAAPEETMCLSKLAFRKTNNGTIAPYTPTDRDIRRAVLHEFGHALGMGHEHMSPLAGINWDLDAVAEEYENPDDPDDVREERALKAAREQVLEPYSREQTNFSDYDRFSIMHYPIPPEWTTDGYTVGWNTELSPTDKIWIAQIYPRGGGAEPVNLQSPVYSCADVHGDGFADLIDVYEQSYQQDQTWFLGGGIAVRFGGFQGFTGPRYEYSSRAWGDGFVRFADVTGDGRADAITLTPEGIAVRVCLGHRFEHENVEFSHRPWGSVGNAEFADVNGDGRADAITRHETGIAVRFSDGEKFLPDNHEVSNRAWGGPGNLWFADVNGDRRADAITCTRGGIAVRLSLGTTLTHDNVEWSFRSWGVDGLGLTFADVNADGKADAIAFLPDGSRAVRLSTGQQFEAENRNW